MHTSDQHLSLIQSLLFLTRRISLIFIFLSFPSFFFLFCFFIHLIIPRLFYVKIKLANWPFLDEGPCARSPSKTNFQPFYRCLMKGTAGRLASQPFFSFIIFHSIHIILSIIFLCIYLFIYGMRLPKASFFPALLLLKVFISGVLISVDLHVGHVPFLRCDGLVNLHEALKQRVCISNCMKECSLTQSLCINN